MSKAKRAANKAANLVVLFELQRAGVLAGMSLQDVANLLDMGHRSTAMRAIRELPEVQELVEAKRALLAERRPYLAALLRQ